MTADRAASAPVPWSMRVAVSMGGPSVWWLPKAQVGRWFLHGGWLLWSFYIEVRRVG